MTKTEAMEKLVKLKKEGEDSRKNFSAVQKAYFGNHPAPREILADAGCETMADYLHYMSPSEEVDKLEEILNA